MNKLTKAALTGVAALGLIGGGLVTGGGAPAAEAAGGYKMYNSKNYCKTVALDLQMSGGTVVLNCQWVPLSNKYLLIWK
ncbi:MAG: hypothetical protein ACTJGQ_07685 [Agrococcus casei]|uniref:hypothetical protein n=1 Tax=Agrococcus casei TaxID=343512 RepID=UPI003F8F846B